MIGEMIIEWTRWTVYAYHTEIAQAKLREGLEKEREYPPV